MEVSATTWSTLSELLDEALDLEPAARAVWIEQLSVTQPALAPSVRKLLEAHASSETADVLARLPTLSGAAPAARVSALSPGDRIGPYRLKREIGSGGMADVWLAERADGAFTREVALKLPLINRLRRDLARRFARERDILARLEHPHIARLYDAGVTDDGLPYLAMEYVDGQSIIEYCDKRKLGIEVRLKLFRQVLDAVQFAHANLIIHRDLKPTNILVTAEGQVRLLDFGIAKLLADNDTARETQLTQLSGRALTPDYASPEQIKGEPLTIATDIYSLGVVLYELLVGSRPYRLKVKSAAQLEQAIVDAEPQQPSSVATIESAAARSATQSTVVRALAGDLDTIVLKTLAKLPAERYSTIAEFDQDLQNHATGLPVRAQPASWSYRARKFILRNRLAVGAAGTIALVLMVATAVSIWQARVAMQQTAVAQRESKRAQAVQRFLLDLFRANTDAQADPVRARETTARELLDAGAARVTQQLSDVPEVQDEVLGTLSDMYRAVGLDNKQAEMERQRVDVRRKMFGPNDPRVAEALIELAATLRATDSQPQIPGLLAEAKTIVDKNPGAPALVRAALLTEFARADMYTDVTRMRRNAHAATGYLKSTDTSPEQLATALRMEALANSFLGNWGAAVGIFEQALDVLRKNDLQPFNNVLSITVELADAHALLGDVPTAERLYREILGESKRRNGETHVDTVHIEARLVNFLHATARREESRHWRSSMLQKLERADGNANLGLAGIVNRNAAGTLFSEGRFGETVKMTTTNAEQSRRHYPNSIALAVRLLHHGLLLMEMGHYAEAASLLSEAASMHSAALGPDAQPVAENRFALAQARLAIASGRARDAIEPLQKLASAPTPNGVVIPLDQLRTKVALAAAHLQLNQVDAASEVARSALEQLEASALRNYYQSLEAEAALQLGRAQLRAGDPHAARLNLERSLSLRLANDHPSSPWISESQIALAECLVALGNEAQARSLVRRAAAIQASHTELGEHYKRPLSGLRQRLG